jgi:hypothetical protein
MKHAFSRSWTNELLCGVCKRDAQTHSDNANCEACGNIGVVDFYPSVVSPMAMVLCENCIRKEKETENTTYDSLRAVNQAVNVDIPDSRSVKININDAYAEHRTVIEARQEFYNLEARAIIELKTKIDNDVNFASIESKRFQLAKIIQDNIITYQKALFEISEKQTEVTNKMRANIVYFNGVIDSLREAEREQLKLRDASYVPNKGKTLNATPSVKLSKTDKTIDTFAKYHKITFDEAKRRLGL